MKQINTRQMQKILKNNGYVIVRTNGNHRIYEKSGQVKHLTISGNLNPCIALRLIKEYNLICD